MKFKTWRITGFYLWQAIINRYRKNLWDERKKVKDKMRIVKYKERNVKGEEINV
jgi:hypothetical protein